MVRTELIKRRRVQTLLHILGRSYEVPAQVYKVTVGTPNYDTGSKSVTRAVHNIRTITFEAARLRKFEYDIGYLAANKNFTYGGFYEQGDRVMIVDRRRIVSGLELEQKDYFIYHGQRYDIQKIVDLDYNAGWFLHLRATKDNTRYGIFDAYFYDRLTFTQEAGTT